MSDIDPLLQPEDAPSIIAQTIDGSVEALEHKYGGSFISKPFKLLARFTGAAGAVFEITLEIREELDENENPSIGAFTDAGIKIATGSSIGSVAVTGLAIAGASIATIIGAPIIGSITLIGSGAFLGAAAATIVTDQINSHIDFDEHIDSKFDYVVSKVVEVSNNFGETVPT